MEAQGTKPTGGTTSLPLNGILAVGVILLMLAAGAAGQLVRLGLFLTGRDLSYGGGLALAIVPLLLLLALLISRLKPGRLRAALLVWWLALPAPLFFIPLEWLDADESQFASALRLLLAALYLLFVNIVVRRKRPRRPPPTATLLPLALVCAALLTYPWFVLGALGSPIILLFDLLAGLLLGLAAALLVAHFWLSAMRIYPAGFWQDFLAGGVVISLCLLILSTNFGFNGGSLLLVLGWPVLGWLAIALVMTLPHGRLLDTTLLDSVWPALAALLGLSAAAPLVFSDTDMLPLRNLLGGLETIVWSLLATVIMAALALLLALILLLVAWYGRKRVRRSARTGIVWALALFLWAGGFALYLLAGQPGFYGDRLFVILKEQADLSTAAGMEDYDQRRLYVYQELTTHADTTQADLRQSLQRLRIGYTPYYLVNALEVRGGPFLRLWLSLHPDVDRVLPSPVLRPLPRSSGPLTLSLGLSAPAVPDWNLQMVRAPEVWETFGARGAGIVIGQSDSGVQWDHVELLDSYRGNENGGVRHDYNWFDPWYGAETPGDSAGHGTHTLGTVLGNQVGVAPDASWIACRNLDRNLGNPALYLNCLQFMLAPFPQDGDPFRDGDPLRSAHVLNNSWGCPEREEGCDAASLEPAVDALRAAGIFVVASAGNTGPECGSVDSAPAIYESAFTVGALDQWGFITSFSSVGPVTVDGSERLKPDIVAPGRNVLSSYPNDGYEYSSGTSMAGPHVAGVVALMWSAAPELIGDIERTEEILRTTAAPYSPGPVSPINEDELALERSLETLGSSHICYEEVDVLQVPNNITGYGVVDAFQAVQAALEQE